MNPTGKDTQEIDNSEKWTLEGGGESTFSRYSLCIRQYIF